MAMIGRYMKLYVGWCDEQWLMDISPAARLAWVLLMCDVKRTGTKGRSKRRESRVKARQWDVPLKAVEEMEAAALAAGALRVEGGNWVITEWPDSDPGRGMNRWKRTRLAVLERDKWTCRYCGEPADQCDHVMPHSRGGTDDPVNLVAACGFCNRSKRDKTPDEWRAN